MTGRPGSARPSLRAAGAPIGAACLAMAALAAMPVHAQTGRETWSGPYGGLTFGLSVSDGRAERGRVVGDILETDVRNGLFPSEIDEGDSGVLGGVSVGYNVQAPDPRLVGGVEADLVLLDQDRTLSFSRIDPEIFVGSATNSTYTTELDVLATLRVRAGYAVGTTLVFATGGLAAGQVENDLGIAIPDVGFATRSFRQEDVLWGYVAGVGVERQLASGLRVRGEALWYDLEDVAIEATDPAAFPGQSLRYEFSNDGAMLRVGVHVPF